MMLCTSSETVNDRLYPYIYLYPGKKMISSSNIRHHYRGNSNFGIQIQDDSTQGHFILSSWHMCVINLDH